MTRKEALIIFETSLGFAGTGTRHMNYIEIQELNFAYGTEDTPAIRQLSLNISQGEFVVVAGSNGSGKSTLLRLIDGLLKPLSGKVVTAGYNTSVQNDIRPLRRIAGMVFQEPENQLTATVAEEDAAFGPENLAFPRDKMLKAVDEALELTGLLEQRKRSTAALSAGQLQRLALAGVLAMNPRCLLLDEPTSMLNPRARHRFMELIHNLNREKGLTVIMVSHHLEEILSSDRLIIMDKGSIVRDGDPDNLLRDRELENWGLVPPMALEASANLHASFPSFPVVTEESRLCEAIRAGGGDKLEILKKDYPLFRSRSFRESAQVPPVQVRRLNHDYQKGTLLRHRALEDVSFTLGRGETACLIGTTGSGKSTLLQHLNGLLLSDAGEVRLMGEEPLTRNTDDDTILALRRQIGLVMQRPEKQLFERYVGDDVAFAPRQQGIEGKSLARRVKRAMETVGLPYAQFRDRPIYALSGGEKRKAALAGVLAMEPEVLLLDEPSAGLDPLSRRELHSLLMNLQKQGVSLVIATHDMDEAALLGHQILLMDKGRLVLSGPPSQIFEQTEELRNRGLEAPFIKRIEEGL